MTERESTKLSWHHVLVTTDLSPEAEPALGAGADLARRVGARVTVLNVVELVGLGDSWGLREALVRLERDYRTEVRPRLEAVCKQHFKDVDVKVEFVEGTAAAEAICRYARENEVDVIVIATHGRTGVKRILVGSVAERVVQQAPCDVIAVRSQSEARGG